MRSRPVLFRLALAGLAGLAACERQPAPAPAAHPPAAPATAPVIAPPPVVGRTELLTALDAAASAHAAGAGGQGQTLAGRRFVVRQAFGCTASTAPAADAPGDGLARWWWGRDRKAIELRLTPGDWQDVAGDEGANPAWEAAEGFWLTRPWLRADGCPAPSTPPADTAAAPSPQTAGLAAVFEQGGSRLGRRNGRAYAFTVRGEAGQPPPLPLGGYRLVLEGRFAAFPDGAAIHCRAESPDQRPVCVAAAQLDRVAFEDPSGVVLSEWRAG